MNAVDKLEERRNEININPFWHWSDWKELANDALSQLHFLNDVIQETLEENAHLADGDNCSLIRLKRAIESIKD